MALSVQVFLRFVVHGENGAIVHYSSSKETSIPLRTGTFFLTDTGAHYEEGSTDITRTTAMG